MKLPSDETITAFIGKLVTELLHLQDNITVYLEVMDKSTIADPKCILRIWINSPCGQRTFNDFDLDAIYDAKDPAKLGEYTAEDLTVFHKDSKMKGTING